MIWDDCDMMSEDPEIIYANWLQRLRRWLRIDTGKLGKFISKEAEDDAGSPPPFRFRKRFDSTFAGKPMAGHKGLEPVEHVNKTQKLWDIGIASHDVFWVELGNLVIRGARVGRELDAVGRASLIPSCVDWVQNNWETCYKSILTSSRHGLQRWRHQIQDSLVTGKRRQVSRWTKGASPLPLLREGETPHAHPHRIGACLRAAWDKVYSPSVTTAMREEELDLMVENIPSRQWRPKPLAEADFFVHVKGKKQSMSGRDQISLTVLQKLPQKAWAPLARIVTLVKDEVAWPSSWAHIALFAIPKLEEHGS